MRIINEANDTELSMLFESIKSELEKKLKKLLGIQINLSIEKEKFPNLYLIDKKNIVSKIGAFGVALREIHVEGNMWKYENSDVFGGYFDFRYKSHNGGANGMTFAEFGYKDGKLTFYSVDEKVI